jgi:NAD(P)-dependent dehydrogenase (short-subunit alcohol dehydrogenase family)
MRRILITGSNRGIGLDLVQRYIQQSDTLIFATCRAPSSADELNALAAQYPERVKVVPLDVVDSVSIAAAQRIISTEVDGLEMLINNAGILPGGVASREPSTASFGSLDADDMTNVLRVNTVSPVIVTQAFADLLRNGSNARVINVSSDAGSLERRTYAGDFSYVASKAGLNMMTRCLTNHLRDAGIMVISIHPGWIQTDMGGPDAILTLDEAIPGMMNVMDNLTLADSGEFFNWDGNRIPW